MAQRSVAESQQSSDLNQIARAIIQDMARELNNCYPMANPNANTETSRIWFTFIDGEDQASRLPTDAIEFVTLTGPRSLQSPPSQPVADLVTVRYILNLSASSSPPSSVGDDTTGLVKFVDLYPGLRSDSYEAEPVQTIGEVRSLNLRFRDSASDEWLDEWNRETELPSAVEVTIGLLRPRGDAKSEENDDLVFFTSAVDLPLCRTPMQSVAEEMQTPASGQEESRAQSAE